MDVKGRRGIWAMDSDGTAGKATPPPWRHVGRSGEMAWRGVARIDVYHDDAARPRRLVPCTHGCGDGAYLRPCSSPPFSMWHSVSSDNHITFPFFPPEGGKTLERGLFLRGTPRDRLPPGNAWLAPHRPAGAHIAYRLPRRRPLPLRSPPPSHRLASMGQAPSGNAGRPKKEGKVCST